MPHLVRLPQVSKSLLISSLTFLLIFTSLPPLAYSAPELGPVKSINGARASLKSSTQPNSDIKQEGVKEAVASRSLSFEANQGQADGNVKFLSRGNGYSLFLTSNEAVLSLRAPAAKPSMAKEPKRGSEPEKSPVGEAAVLRMRLEGANKNPRIEGLERQTGVANYFRGNDPKKWREGVSTYARVKYHQVYSGIDLVYYSRKQELEYDFIVAPGADVRSIRLSFGGAEKVEINDQGELVLKTKAGEVRHRKPVIYQEAGGKRQEVSGRYVMRGKRQVGFEVGEYDRTRPLVIDPVIAYSTLLGGSNDAFGSYSFANGIATHTAADGTVYTYVVGTTVANDFPIRNGWQSIYSGAGDVFVVKLKMSASGDASLVYSTFLGGDHSEQGWGIAVDVGGNAYVAGLTHSRNFPIRNAPQASHGGGTFDAFIAKLNADGSELEYSTYLGGSGDDRANSIAIDSAGNAYLTGQTTSGNFPPVNAYSTVYGSRNTIFVAKIAPPSNGNSASLAYSTYLGGSGYTNGDNSGNGVAVDSAGNAYVTGITAAPNFPIVNGFQTELQCSVGNAFVAKLNPSASGPASLLYSTYIGGLCPFGTGDTGTGIAVDSAGKAYVTGTTVSQDFPTTPGAFTRDYRTGFVAKIDPSKSGTESLIYSTFLGGASPDVSHRGRSIAVDADGNAYVTGSTISFDFPLVNSIQSFNSGAFQSINGGDSWVGINNGLTIPTINALAIDTSTSPRTLYAGAADYHHFTGGVFKSTNGGASWSGTNTGLTNTDVRTLVISPTDPSTLYVATGGGIFRSVNAEAPGAS